MICKKETVTAFDVSRAHWWRRLGCFKGRKCLALAEKGILSERNPDLGSAS